MTEIAASPFERASKLRESRSSPPNGSKSWAVPKRSGGHAKDDDYRLFQSPEAVKGFMLQAYRPGSLPLAQKKQLNGDAPLPDDVTSERTLEPQLSVAAELQWPDSDVGALSIAGSPTLMRTDVPLTRFRPPRDCASMRRASMGADLQSVARARLELAARSMSAPAVFESLHVQELWDGVQAQPAYNPFANTPDTEGIFGIAY